MDKILYHQVSERTCTPVCVCVRGCCVAQVPHIFDHVQLSAKFQRAVKKSLWVKTPARLIKCLRIIILESQNSGNDSSKTPVSDVCFFFFLKPFSHGVKCDAYCGHHSVGTSDVGLKAMLKKSEFFLDDVLFLNH